MSFKKPNYDFYDEKKFLFENLKDEDKNYLKYLIMKFIEKFF